MACKHRDPKQSVHVIDCYFLKSRTDCVGGHTHTKLKKTKKQKQKTNKTKQNKTKEKEEEKKRLRKIGLTEIRTRTLGTS